MGGKIKVLRRNARAWCLNWIKIKLITMEIITSKNRHEKYKKYIKKNSVGGHLICWENKSSETSD